VATSDHEEDWFIFAKTARSAAKLHESTEGYLPHDAQAELVLSNTPFTEPLGDAMPCHAQIDNLQALGFELFNDSSYPRVVRLGCRVFREGCMEALIAIGTDNLAEAIGKVGPMALHALC
jgi:hypothetical protein